MCNIGIHCSVFAKCLNGKKKIIKLLEFIFSYFVISLKVHGRVWLRAATGVQ